MVKGIYLDNSTTTKPSVIAINKMIPFFTDYWGSSSAPHQMGNELLPVMQESYRAIYHLLGAPFEDDLIITSSGAEAINQVINSTYWEVSRPTGKNQYITSNIEEAPILMSIGRLEQLGCIGKMVNATSDGYITPENIQKAITPRTALVSLSWVNGLTGVINPISDIATICEERGILFHVDATHALGKVFFELNDIGAHFITFNGDHLHAPKGTGCLYVKQGTKCTPFIVGGAEQAGFRAGHVNIASLVGLGQAAQELIENRDFLCTEIARLRNLFENGIVKGFPTAKILFRDSERIPNCSTIAFPGIINEALLFALNRKGVYANIGGGTCQQIGLVLSACGIEESMAHSAINFCLSRETSETDVQKAIEIITETAKQLSKLAEKIITAMSK